MQCNVGFQLFHLTNIFQKIFFNKVKKFKLIPKIVFKINFWFIFSKDESIWEDCEELTKFVLVQFYYLLFLPIFSLTVISIRKVSRVHPILVLWRGFAAKTLKLNKTKGSSVKHDSCIMELQLFVHFLIFLTTVCFSRITLMFLNGSGLGHCDPSNPPSFNAPRLDCIVTTELHAKYTTAQKENVLKLSKSLLIEWY